jgi:hypothetical protein
VSSEDDPHSAHRSERAHSDHQPSVTVSSPPTTELPPTTVISQSLGELDFNVTASTLRSQPVIANVDVSNDKFNGLSDNELD